MTAFRAAAPLRPTVDRRALARAQVKPGPYRVVAGDLLAIEMPEVMRAMAEDPASAASAFQCRVQPPGEIYLPEIGSIPAAGRTLAEIESAVLDAYHPRYVRRRPTVVASVTDYRTVRVTVFGSVQSPGIHELRSDESSLVALLMKAGANLKDAGAVVHIHSPSESRPVGLPVEGLDVPFADVALAGGETIEIEEHNPRIFTILGLVNNQGTFPYPEGVEYNLNQAIGVAGGVSEPQAPRYVKLFRRGVDGEIAEAVVKIGPDRHAETSRIMVRPGDVIALDHTARTLVRQLFAQIVSFQTGIQYRLDNNDR